MLFKKFHDLPNAEHIKDGDSFLLLQNGEMKNALASVFSQFLKELGANPTDEQVAAAVAAYLAENSVGLERVAALHVWATSGAALEDAAEVRLSTRDVYDPDGTSWETLEYSADVTETDGVITLVNPSALKVSSTNAAGNLRGNFFALGGTIYFAPSDALFTQRDIVTDVSGTSTMLGVGIYTSDAKKVTGMLPESYIDAAGADAYPANGSVDGIRYVYLGQLGDSLKNSGGGGAALPNAEEATF